jgi:hypothetical protein
MSRTTIYAFYAGRPWEVAGEFSNSWGSGYFIWKALQEKYLPQHNGTHILKPEIAKEIWGLAHAGTPASEAERLVLLTTFDYALARRSKFHEIAQALREFKAEHYKGDVVCSLGEQADLLDKLARDESIQAAGWQQTSCGDNLWMVRDDKDEDEERHYDPAVDGKHWYIGEEEEP